jgi:hypothetical protein
MLTERYLYCSVTRHDIQRKTQMGKQVYWCFKRLLVMDVIIKGIDYEQDKDTLRVNARIFGQRNC